MFEHINVLLVQAFVVAMVLPLPAVQAEDGPREPIENYFEAHATGNADFIRQAFAPDAKILSVKGTGLQMWTRDEFAKRFTQPAGDEFRRVRRIERLDVSGNAASAVLTLDYPSVRFTDHVSLLKTQGQWQIVNKVFSADPKPDPAKLKERLQQERAHPFAPMRIIGNIYYVGASQISSFLIVTSAGHILLDTGPVDMLPQVTASIAKLGFRVEDVKILLNSHAHFDHCGGFAEFRRRTAASIVASKLDGEAMTQGGKGDLYWGDDIPFEPVTPDRMIGDGDQVQLGGVTLTALLTPGHTKGCTSWRMDVEEGGKKTVLFECALTASGYKLNNNDHYPNIVQDVRATLRRLKNTHADVMLAPHAFYFDLRGKVARMKAGAPNPFIDPTELGRHVEETEKEFEAAVQAQERQR